MKLQDARAAYQDYSRAASDIVRQLGFAGIALIWLFKTGDEGTPDIPDQLRRAGLLIVVALTFDLMQYVSGALIWGIYNRRSERTGRTEAEEFMAPHGLNWPTLAFFWGKICFIVVAYIVLGAFVVQTIR